MLAGCASMTSQTTTDSTSDSALPTSATVGDNDIIAIAVPGQKCCPKQTLPQFLGLDQLGAGIGGIFQRVFSRIQTSLGLEGKFPGLQPEEPLKNITDPANLSEDSPPAVQAAAKIKAEQDQAKQKIQALRYLATIGCGGCYPEVEDALLEALTDCTESVRYEAVKALRGKRGTSCCYCSQNGCCSAKVQKKLNEIVSKVDQAGNYMERSARVRRLARVVLNGCPPAMESSQVPEEGPSLLQSRNVPARDEVQAVLKVFDSAVRPASFEMDAESGDESENDFCLASINGYKLMASELKMHSGSLSRENLENRIRELVAQQQFIKENRQFHRWDDSCQPEFVLWLKQKGFLGLTLESELKAYYENNLDEFASPASVRWEAVSVSFQDLSKKALLRQELEQLRENLNAQRPVSSVALEGAVVQTFDWTQPREIKNASLRQAIFQTGVGKISGIVEMRSEMILVRVLERKNPGTQDFESVRTSIRERLDSFQVREAMNSLYYRVRSDYQIWSLFDRSESPSDSSPTSADRSFNEGQRFNGFKDSQIDSQSEGVKKNEPLIRRLSTN